MSLSLLARAGSAAARTATRPLSTAASKVGDIFTPTEEHAALRSMVRKFTVEEIEPQVRPQPPTYVRSLAAGGHARAAWRRVESSAR
jgi:hypothetical protein